MRRKIRSEKAERNGERKREGRDVGRKEEHSVQIRKVRGNNLEYDRSDMRGPNEDDGGG